MRTLTSPPHGAPAAPPAPLRPRPETRWIGVAFAATVLVAGAITFGSIAALRSALSSHERLAFDLARALAEAQSLEAAAAHCEALVRTYLATGDDHLLEQARRARDEIAAGLARLEPPASRAGRGAGVRADLAAIRNADTRFWETAERATILRAAGDAAGALALFHEEAQPAHDTLDAAVTALAELQARRLVAAADRAAAAARRTLGLIAAITGASLALAAALAVVLLRALGHVHRRIETAEALRTSEARLAGIVGTAMDAIVSFDEDRRIVLLNGAAERMFRRSAAETIGERLEVLLPARAQPLRHASRAPGALVGVRADGEEFPIEATVSHVEAADHELCTIILRDVTERRRADAAKRFLLEASVVLARSLDAREMVGRVARLAVPDVADLCVAWLAPGDEAPDGDGAWEVAGADPSLEDTVRALIARHTAPEPGWAAARQVARTGLAAVIPDADAAKLLPLATDDEGPALARLGGGSVLAVPIAAGERTRGALTLFAGAPRRRYSIEDLALAEDLGRRVGLALENARLYHEARAAVRARDEFLSIASHELKTPLTALRLQVEATLRRAVRPGDGRVPEWVIGKLQGTGRHVGRLAKLVNSLLDVSRLSGGRLELELEEVDLAAVARDVVVRLAEEAEEARTPLSIVAPAPVAGRWDRLRLEQIATNLLTNALKYGAGRPVEVVVEGSPERARLIVRDHGVGIRREDQARIFERFERLASTRHFGGFGLGLWIVRQIVEALGGAVTVESEVGEGAEFCVELPRAAAGAAPDRTARAAGES